MDFFVKTDTIERWADSIEARSALPHLARRLVASTVEGLTELDFPAYEATQRRGFDGVVVCKRGNVWVPDGRSVWEMGTNKDPKRKADREIRKRSDTSNTPREAQEQTTFVFVTPRSYGSKNKWVEDNRRTGHWKAVKFLDADDLEHWVEAAPYGVRAWFGRLIGARPFGIEDVATRWEAISKSADRPLQPSVFLAGRARSKERISDWLVAEPSRLRLECRSPIELIDFFCAVIASMDESDRTREESRAIIVHTPDAWEAVRESTAPSVFVLAPDLSVSMEEVVRALSNGHHVLSATEPQSLTGDRQDELERASQFELTQALEECGYEPVFAEQQARAAGGSLAILKQGLQKTVVRPAWVDSADSEIATACLLLGGWTESDADKTAFETISGKDYALCEAVLQQWASCRDSLLFHAAGNWRLVSKDFAWSILQERVSASAMQRFEPLAVDILADDDPRYSLPEEERPFANIQGHVPKYSDTIKKHVAETLAFLGQFGSTVFACSSIDLPSIVQGIVGSVLSPGASWHRWASLGSRLPMLAEACPSVFLRAVREDLERAEPELGKLLHEEQDTFWGRCNHAGLLWALEALAWSKRHLAEVMRTLLTLDSIDPRGRWSNRPKNSIGEIFSYWMPHTTATVDERIQILDLLIEQNREAVWAAFIDLLPQAAVDVSMPTNTPYWRDWANDWTRGATQGDSLKFITAVAERLIHQAGEDSQRWKGLFENIGALPYTVHEEFVSAAMCFSQTEHCDRDRRALNEELSRQINRHRALPDASWPIPSAVLDQLEIVAANLEPKDVVLRNAWLFEPYPDRCIGGSTEWKENDQKLEEARRAAISEILKTQGYAGIEALIENANSPHDVGRCLAAVSQDEYVARVVPARLDGQQRHLAFAKGFVLSRFWPDHWDWADKTICLCDSESSKAWFYSMLPFNPEVWERAERSGDEVRRLYWERCEAFNPRLDVDDVTVAVGELVSHSRPAAGIDVLATALRKNRELDTETLFAPLEGLLALPPDKSEPQLKAADTYHIRKLVETLQKRQDVDTSRLIRIEWNFLRLLSNRTGHAPHTLHRHLADHPEFFVEVLSCCYRRSSERDRDDRPRATEHTRYMARQASRLLHDWNVIPGTQSDGSVSESALREWCNTALARAELVDRRDVCENHIGQVFGKVISVSPEEADATWPCRAIQVVCEEIATHSFESGMYFAIRNSRGVTFRASGGDQERELSQSYRSKANAIRFTSPVIARILDSVADSYANEAKWWDERDRWEDR